MDFNEKFTTWLAGIQEKINKEYTESYPSLDIPKLHFTTGKKYVRVIKGIGDQQSAFSFINMENGDVLKPDGWKNPAKHARGNIFDKFNGLKYVGYNGPMYLK